MTTSDSQAEETPTEFPSPLASVVTSGDSQAEEILTEPPPPLASTVTSGDSQAEETSTESPPPTKRVLTSGDHESQEENKIPEINYSDLEFGAELGEGGFSTVYKGHWLSRDMDVAIKRLPGKLHEGEVRHVYFYPLNATLRGSAWSFCDFVLIPVGLSQFQP